MESLTCDVCHAEISESNQGQTTADNVICADCLKRLSRWLNYDYAALEKRILLSNYRRGGYGGF